MPSTNIRGAPVNTSRREPAGPGMGSSRAARARRRSARPNTRHLGEICPVIVVMMPFGVPLWLAVRFRKWLRRRVGRKAGNVLGKVAIITFGRPPLVFPCVIFRLLGLVQKLLNKLDHVTRTRRPSQARRPLAPLAARSSGQDQGSGRPPRDALGGGPARSSFG